MMLATLRNRNFSLLWFAGWISIAGNWILAIGLPLYIYRLTESTMATSIKIIAYSTNPCPRWSGWPYMLLPFEA